MFAANTDFEFGLSRTAFLDTHLNELAYTLLVEHFEGIYLDDADLFVVFQELGSVVARVSECHLSEVVGTE